MCVGVWIATVAMAAFAAQPRLSVGDIVALVRSGMGRKQPDARIAKALHGVQLVERLDAETVDRLESEGAGPRTVTELQRMRSASAGLPPPADTGLHTAPPLGEQKRILDLARESALHYTKSLPDFICTELVRRYEGDGSKPIDTLTIKLSYFEEKEKYELLTINGRRTVLPYTSVGGVITQGEFGSLLNEIFELRSDAAFHWDHGTTLRQRPTEVYTFRVPPERSHYRMAVGRRGERYDAVVGQHGLVYLDGETGRTVRIIAEADSLPSDFPVLSSSTTLDYGFADIAGGSYLLPLHAETRMRTRETDTRNEVDFQSYKKFVADSSITYTNDKR